MSVTFTGLNSGKKIDVLTITSHIDIWLWLVISMPYPHEHIFRWKQTNNFNTSWKIKRMMIDIANQQSKQSKLKRVQSNKSNLIFVWVSGNILCWCYIYAVCPCYLLVFVYFAQNFSHQGPWTCIFCWLHYSISVFCWFKLIFLFNVNHYRY